MVRRGLRRGGAILDFARSDTDRQVIQLLFEPLSFAWPLLAPPRIPSERVELLRHAFDETILDPALIADAGKLNLEVHPMTGAAINKTIARLYDFAPGIVQTALAYTAKQGSQP